MLDINKIKSYKIKRAFIDKSFEITSWDSIRPYIDDLINENFDSNKAFEAWLMRWSELDGIISQDIAWRYINMTIDTSSETYKNHYSDFVENISPKLQKAENELNKKASKAPFKDTKNGAAYLVFLRNIKSSIALFREDNIPLKTEEQLLEKKYGEIAGKMCVILDGKELTMPIAASYLKDTNRNLRKKVWELVNERRYEDHIVLDTLLSKMIKIRNRVALNAGFKNYRDYKFKALHRFDYSPIDCFRFHDSCKTIVLPLVNKLLSYRKEKLSLKELKPWDLSVDIEGKKGLKAYNNEDAFIESCIDCFSHIDPYFGECLSVMQELGYLDLFSRKNKAPGGYNYPLEEVGVPFIFMNAAGTIGDITTLVHEGGHAVHSFLTRDIPMVPYRSAPMEVSEVASMAMELISMEHWEYFFPKKEELKRAKIYQLERVIDVLPWIAQVDEFQHFIYENPEHSIYERKNKWLELCRSYSTGIVDQKENHKYQAYSWQKQLHIFEVPFYYIEYGIAQLGAIGLWMQYKQNPKEAIENYKKMLKNGNTKTIPELYKSAGLKFDFSPDYIKTLFVFVNDELLKLLD